MYFLWKWPPQKVNRNFIFISFTCVDSCICSGQSSAFYSARKELFLIVFFLSPSLLYLTTLTQTRLESFLKLCSFSSSNYSILFYFKNFLFFLVSRVGVNSLRLQLLNLFLAFNVSSDTSEYLKLWIRSSHLCWSASKFLCALFDTNKILKITHSRHTATFFRVFVFVIGSCSRLPRPALKHRISNWSAILTLLFPIPLSFRHGF